MEKKLNTLRITQILLYINAVVWVFLGVFYSIHTISHPVSQYMIVILMVINAAIFTWLGWGVGKKNPFFLYASYVFLGVNILLTITDEFGTLDIIVLVLNIIIIGLLISSRKQFINKKERDSEG